MLIGITITVATVRTAERWDLGSMVATAVLASLLATALAVWIVRVTGRR